MKFLVVGRSGCGKSTFIKSKILSKIIDEKLMKGDWSKEDYLKIFYSSHLLKIDESNFKGFARKEMAKLEHQWMNQGLTLWLDCNVLTDMDILLMIANGYLNIIIETQVLPKVNVLKLFDEIVIFGALNDTDLKRIHSLQTGISLKDFTKVCDSFFEKKEPLILPFDFQDALIELGSSIVKEEIIHKTTKSDGTIIEKVLLQINK